MAIFITQKQISSKHNLKLDALEHHYLAYLQTEAVFGQNQIFIPVINQLMQVKALLQSMRPEYIVFTGGNNVMPKTAAEAAQVGDFAPERDEVESFLIDYADRHGIPKLAICRGFQFLNIYYGGELQYFLQDHPPGQDHSCEYQGHRYIVNSYHDHGILNPQLSSKLTPIVTALADGKPLVEGYINATTDISPTLAVQWHPERGTSGRELFELLWKQFKT